MGRTIASIQAELDGLYEQALSLYHDLERMPRHLDGTEWHTDRVKELRWLSGAMERVGKELGEARTVAARLRTEDTPAVVDVASGDGVCEMDSHTTSNTLHNTDTDTDTDATSEDDTDETIMSTCRRCGASVSEDQWPLCGECQDATEDVKPAAVNVNGPRAANARGNDGAPQATRRPTLASVKAAAKAIGARVERDGVGGYELLAPDGCRWVDAEVWCYPIPTNEAESPEEKREMLESASRVIAGGIEPIE